MQKRFKTGIVCLLVGGILLVTLWQLGYLDPPAQYDIQLDENLKDAAGIPIGVAVDTYRLQNDNAYRSFILQHFNCIVAEWQMKMKAIYLGPGEYEWTYADYLVHFAYENNIAIHGHTLLWHESIPQWLKDYTGSDAEFAQLVENYVRTVVGRYKDNISTWDVVNEAFTNAGYRDTLFLQRLGPNYLADVYQWAHEADPDCQLYYNDYGTLEDPTKTGVIIAEIQKLLSTSAPIHGIGIQGHLHLNDPDLTSIAIALGTWNALGLNLRISELDVSINWDGLRPVFTQARAESQRDYYHNVVEKFLTSPHLTSISVWGFDDAHSWLPNHHHHPDWPLLFDGNYEPKPAAEGFLRALQGL